MDDLGYGQAINICGSFSTDIGHVLISRLEFLNTPAASCREEPYGEMALYLMDVGWLDMTLDGTPIDDPERDTPNCDGCLTLRYRDVVLGDICPDFSGLISWESRPWD